MDWNKREVKNEVRNLVLSSLDIEKPIRYLGLPAEKAIFEHMLCDSFDVERMDLFEINSDIYSRLVHTDLPVGDLALFNGDVDNFIQEKSDNELSMYNLIWLDYCGPINQQRLENLSRILWSSTPGSFYAFTFMIGREKGSIKKLLDISSLRDIWSKRLNIINAFIPDTLKFDILIQPYFDHAPMVLLIFKKLNDFKSTGNVNRFDLIAGSSRGKPVVINGASFNSVFQASRYLNMKPSAIYYRLNSTKYPNFNYKGK